MSKTTKTPKIIYTPWQLWAQDYQAKIPTFLRGDPEEVDKYSHAAWEECKKRVMAILIANLAEYTAPGGPAFQMEPDLRYIKERALEEIKKL